MEILSEKFAKVNENFREAYIFDNFNFLQSRRPVRKLDSEFFTNLDQIDRSLYINLKVSNFVTNNIPKTLLEIQQETNLILTQEKLNKIVSVCRDFGNRHAKLLEINQSSTTLSILFSRLKKGSKTLRNILHTVKNRNLPHNMIKYAEITNTVINDKEGELLNGLWGFNFLDNALRTFCFKLHNNTLGYNYTVSKFVRTVSPICTFCTISRNVFDEIENPLHIFYQCRHVEPIIHHIYTWILGVENFNRMTRSNYFGGFTYSNLAKNWVLNLINLLIKKYLWDCKLRTIIPSNNMAESYLKNKIKTYYEINSTFRKKWGKADINIHF